jgi:uncharacterized membrane protein
VRLRNTIFGLVVLAFLLITFSVFYGYFINVNGSFFPNERGELGQFGDYFGGALNPIFGFASFLALLVTIFYQSKELKLSRNELEFTRKELANSASALDAQNKAIELQSFEQTFFSWLNTYHSLLNNVTEEKKINSIPHKISGRAALKEFWGQFFNYGFLEALTGVKAPTHSYSKILEDWDKLFLQEDYQLDCLFRTLYRLILWVDTQNTEKLTTVQKWLYISIVRSQLSSIELYYLYLNGLTDRGSKFKILAEKYALFDNLTFSDSTLLMLINDLPENHKYSQEAYKSSLAKKKFNN